MAKKSATVTEPEITETQPVAVVEKAGLALFLEKYMADQTLHPGELRSLRWEAAQGEHAVVTSKYGRLVWPDGAPAIFSPKHAAEIAAHLRPIRPLDQINTQPA